MPTKGKPTRKQIIQQVLSKLDGPTLLDDLIEQVHHIYPSQAKNPRHVTHTELNHHEGRLFVFLDAQTILPMRLAFTGVRFRIRLDPQETKHGVLIIQTAFDYFLAQPPAQASFVDSLNQPLPTRLVKLAVKTEEELFGLTEVKVEAFDLKDWFRANKIRKGDDVLVIILDWESAHFRLEHEPARQRRADMIAQQNRALADILYDLMEETYDESIRLRVAIPTAYARMPTAHDYPGDHWLIVLDQDKRMGTDGYVVKPLDQIGRLFVDEGEAGIEEQPFTAKQAQQVYRFQATTYGGKKPRSIEIQGGQTLDELDAAMRDAFDLDTFDHLSEFTRIIKRGKGKKAREIPYGELNPFEKTPAGELRVAGLGLEVGAELRHVYDFGDWIQHILILEDIHTPEQDVEYPRYWPVAK